MDLELVSLNLGRVSHLGSWRGHPIRSGIAKSPVISPEVHVHASGIDGDEQADLFVHGGADKAIYAYPSDHWAWWKHENNLACAPGTFGENLTLAGAVENEISIGDRFQWGDVVLEVSQPRAPCFKLGLHTKRGDVPRLLTLSANCGWYLRVVQQGNAGRQTPLKRIHHSDGPSVRDTFRALYDPQTDVALVRKVYEHPALARDWCAALVKKIR